ncbi:PTC2-4 [Biomphalaria pfeifferi]|uniref:PTC2-4 n=1 Tax=Biomphalaria pfeifferi TaxID=112525 RepID=A0AAD8C5Y1_BIOPF|nr:PTC2-4 [Biomphalaria pfeifferi]
MEKAKSAHFFRLSIYSTLYLTICISFYACERCVEEECILLFANHTVENKARCNIGYVDGLEKYVVKGRVNITDKNVVAVGLENVAGKQLGIPSYFCLIRFVKECNNNQTDLCYCVATDQRNVFNIVFNMTLTYQDRNAQARAVMLLSDRQEIFSNDIKLPNVTQLDLTNVSYVLNINGKKVHTEKCLKSVPGSTLHISYDVLTSQNLRTELRITSDNKTDLWRDTKEGSFTLPGLSVEAASDVYFTFNLCGFSEKIVFCTFIKGEHYDRNGPTIGILSGFFALSIVIVIILLAIWIYFHKVKTKRKRFQMHGGRKPTLYAPTVADDQIFIVFEDMIMVPDENNSARPLIAVNTIHTQTDSLWEPMNTLRTSI